MKEDILTDVFFIPEIYSYGEIHIIDITKTIKGEKYEI